MNWTPMMTRSALEVVARRHAHEMGHRLGAWAAAKHKIGKDATKAECLDCGMCAFLLPHGHPKGRTKTIRDTPGIRGDALFEPCSTTARQQGRLL